MNFCVLNNYTSMHFKYAVILYMVYLFTSVWGNGLNQQQLEKFIELYKHNKTNNGCIDPGKIEQILIEFEIDEESQKELFRSSRPTAKELMELIIVTAEHSKTDHTNNKMVFCAEEIRKLITFFKKLDKDKNDILSGDEAKKFVEEFFVTMNLINGIEINVAQYLLFLLIQKHQTPNDSCSLEQLLKICKII
ncbi:uncharacterized protein LOC126833977 [Adelges cooleyi]|uniref:uncharacterized protein LOC126833977 n=1 Tax=Adelges cooleyi TaxID=133065 RepID=UPI00217F5220|nr:uncharacterized protein LOC126833977 [Adelges cooleyi]